MSTTQRYPVKNSALPPGTWRRPTHAEGKWLEDEDERPSPESMFDSEFEEQPDVQAALLSIFARPGGELVGPRGSRQSRKRAGPADGLDDDERERGLFCATIGMADTKISRSEAKRAAPPQIQNLKMRWPKGCIRLTRTLGRENNPNTILLSDVIIPSALKSIWLHVFNFDPSLLLPLLPLRGLNLHGLRKVPCFIGQDLKQDRAAVLYPPDSNSPEAVHDQIAHELVKAYTDLYGEHYHPIYPKGGLAHSKIILAVYPSFLRLWIGSANLHGFDTTQSDNHWFVQDLPLLEKARRRPKYDQEVDILAHAASLSCPEEFLSSIEGKYGWSEVKFHVVTSVPRTVSKLELGDYGAFRLRSIAHSILSLEESRNATIESCSASLGRLKSTWLDTMRHLLVGGHKRHAPPRYQPYPTRSRSSRRSPSKTSDGEDEERDQARTKSRRGTRAPALKIVYPNQTYVENSASFQMRKDSRNMGAHIDWDHAAASTQGFFHDYVSNGTPGTHLHQKFLLCLPPDARPSTLPHFAYLGSHNFSAGAYGDMWLDKNKKWHNKMANWEIGIVLEGKHLPGLVEGGDWEQIVTYERPPRPYGDRRPFQWGKVKESEA